MELVARHRIIPALRGEGKKEVLLEVAQAAARELGMDAAGIHAALLDREKMGTTGIGDGIAIPHAKVPGLTEIVVYFARSPRGVPFGAVDNRAVHLFFVLLAPEDPGAPYLSCLARLSRVLKDPAVRDRLMQAENTEDLYGVLASCRVS